MCKHDKGWIFIISSKLYLAKKEMQHQFMYILFKLFPMFQDTEICHTLLCY